MIYIFSWVPAYQSIAQQLLGFRNRQGELIQLLKQIGADVMDDEDSPGHKIQLSEIDPFTFICHLNKYGDFKRKQLLRNLCEQWNIPVVINDVNGIPSANAQRLWLYPFKYSRTNKEIDRLWNFYEHFMADTLNDQLFADVLEIQNVGKQKITELMFTCKSSQYLCLNSVVKPYLNEVHQINSDFTTYTELQSLLTKIRLKVRQPFHVISYEGYLHKAFKDQPINYYRIGSTVGDSGKSVLPEMIRDKIISVGWSDIGDIEELSPINKTTVQQALQESGYKPNDNKVASRKAGEILTFYEKIKPFDIAVVVEGQQVKAIGQVYTDNYVFNDANEFAHSKVVEWFDTQVTDLKISEGLNTSVVKLEYPETIQAIQSYLTKKKLYTPQKTKPTMDSKTLPSLNTILFGPPGTGKTFNSINHAIAIIDNKEIDVISNQERSVVKSQFDNYLKEGRIVFTTFHQSLSYEDFIEGIKPLKPINGQIGYEVVPGLFKRAAAMAGYFCYKLFNKSNRSETGYSFDDLYDAFIDATRHSIESGSPPVYKTLRGREVEIKDVNSNESIIARAKNSVAKSSAPLTRENIQKLYDRFKTVEEIKDLQQVKDTVEVSPRITEFYAVFRGLKEFENDFKPDEAIAEENDLSEIIDVNEIQKKFDSGVFNEAIKNVGDQAESIVFIIDEINRGNVSQIFGELITLIEDDKRIGRREALEVILPYSKDRFGVPPNLYLIGTMNTADRSVEALDTALRRRFSFKEIPPDSKLITTKGKLNTSQGKVEGIDLASLLDVINNRIEKLLDKDHLIGHSYFMNIEKLSDLKQVFQNKINPLLQEYFYGDFGKIGLVIGKTFFTAESLKANDDDDFFAEFPEYETSELLERRSYHLGDIIEMNDQEFINALNKLLRK